jgi:hypothetical protein
MRVRTKIIASLIVSGMVALINCSLPYYPFSDEGALFMCVLFLLAPGLALGLLMGENIHSLSFGFMVLGNIIAYFALTWVVLFVRDKLKVRAESKAELRREFPFRKDSY